MKKKFKIGLLSTIDNPLLPLYISSLISQDLRDLIVICDSKEISKRDRRIFLRRTNGDFSEIDSLNKLPGISILAIIKK